MGGAASPRHPARGRGAVVGEKIVVVGGQADQKLVRQTEVFDGKRWTDVADIPTPRDIWRGFGRALPVRGGRTRVVGGQEFDRAPAL